jgi:hypothetical protein
MERQIAQDPVVIAASSFGVMHTAKCRVWVAGVDR